MLGSSTPIPGMAVARGSSNMIKDYPGSSRPAYRAIAQETLAALALAILYPFGLRRKAVKPTPRVRRQRTVVLVHGYLCNPSVFYPMSAYMRYHGMQQVLHYGYDSTQGVERGAIGLREFLRRTVRGGEVDLVCHSLGGLVARSYLQELGGARRVERCITLGTPHFGTYNAYWLWSRVGKELRPDSPLLQRLNATRAAAASVDFLSIIAGSDNLVIPRVFAGHEKEVCIPDLGHLSVLLSPRVLGMVTNHLNGVAPVVESSPSKPFFHGDVVSRASLA
jgi:triacylglycerol lipase